jgi:acetyl-CoA acyltransferase 1
MLTSTVSTSKNADDVVITLAIRTPLAKGFKGGFKDTELDYLIYSLLKKVIEKSRIDPQLVEDICCGNVRPPRSANFIF